MRCNIPVQTACSGVEIRGAQSHEKGGAKISLALSIDLPVEDLIAALSIFQQSNERPSPEELPSVFEAHKAQAQVGGYTSPMKVSEPQKAMARESGPSGQSGPRSNLAPPPGLTAQWETIGAPLASLGAGAGHRSMMTRIKVTNLVRRLKSQEVQTVFERYVGPITHCNLMEDAASITFLSPEHAQAAIDRYNGGIMEVRTDKSAPGEPLILYPKDSTFRRTLEDRLGPLTECHLRRGEGWMTLFRGSITKQLKREEALNQIDFKGSLLNISFEVPTQPPMAPQPGMVFGQPMVL